MRGRVARYLPFLYGASASLLILLVVAASGMWFYLRASEEIRSNQRKVLSNAAAAAAALVDPETHASFTSADQETTAAYLDAIGRLERVRAANPDFKYVYTCVLRGDSAYFVLDPTPAGDQDGDGVDDKSHIRQPYPDAGPACLKALRTGRPAADDAPYSDAWGTFISAYAPFFGADGKPAGVVGVDMEIGRSLGELRGMRRAAAYGFLIAAVLALAAGAGVASAVRWRQAADALRQRTLEQLAGEKARAEEATRAKGDFLATMSHEIRTPIGAVLGMLDLMLDRPMEPAQEQRARMARRSVEHLLALLNNVLDFSKMEAGRVEMESIPFDPDAVFREVESLLRGQAEEKGLALAYRPSGLPAMATGDPGRLRQVLINLVGNAIKFTERGGVEVTAAWEPAGPSGGRLEASVADTGIGVAPEKLGQLFRMFSQADASTTRRYGGTGLGLAICRRLVESMGGKIDVESRPGKGSTFRFHVPLAAAGEGAYGADAAREEAAASVMSAFRAPALPVLVAEDHPINRLVARQTLERLGCKVECAADGREALARAAGGDFAAVLMDCRMPGMDGYQAARSIRALPGRRGRVPIIAVTANSEEEERRRCLDSGMDGVLTKPLRRRELVEALLRWAGDDAERGSADGGGSAAPRRAAILDGLVAAMGEPDPAFLRELVRLFLDAAPGTVRDLESSLTAGDGSRAAREAHTLTGAGLQIGASSLAEACRRLERAASANDLVRARELLQPVKEEMARAEDALRGLVIPPEGAAAG